MFSQASVILFTGGVWHTPPSRLPNPRGQTPLPPFADPPGQTPLWADTPWADPPGQTPPWADHSPTHPLLPKADGYCIGLYASYCNAFLFEINLYYLLPPANGWRKFCFHRCLSVEGSLNVQVTPHPCPLLVTSSVHHHLEFYWVFFVHTCSPIPPTWYWHKVATTEACTVWSRWYPSHWNDFLLHIMITSSWGKVMFSQASVCPLGGHVWWRGVCVAKWWCVMKGECAWWPNPCAQKAYICFCSNKERCMLHIMLHPISIYYLSFSWSWSIFSDHITWTINIIPLCLSHIWYVMAAGSLSPETCMILVDGYWLDHDTSEWLCVGMQRKATAATWYW